MGPGVGRGVGSLVTFSTVDGVGSTLGAGGAGVVAIASGAGVLVAFGAVTIAVGAGLTGEGITTGVGTAEGVALDGVGIAVGVGSFGELVDSTPGDGGVERGSNAGSAGFAVAGG